MGLYSRIEKMKCEESGVTKVTDPSSLESLQNRGLQVDDARLQKVTMANSLNKSVMDDENDSVMAEIYDSLMRCGLTDLETGNPDAAQFLFAWGLARDTPDHDYEAMCREHVPYWRKRLHPIAWRMLAGVIKQRLDRSQNTSTGPIQQTISATGGSGGITTEAERETV